jgi:tetratricopeptide (TPR) repeat protein
MTPARSRFASLLAAALISILVPLSFADRDGDDDDGKTITKKEFIEQANHQFDRFHKQYPDFDKQIDRAKGYFNDNAEKQLTQDSYQGKERHFIKDNLDIALKAMGATLKNNDDLNNGRITMAAFAERNHEIADGARTASMQVKALYGGGTMKSGGPGGASRDDVGDVEKLAKAAAQYGFTEPKTPGSGSNSSGGGVLGGGNGGSLSGGPTSGTGATPNGTGGGDDSSFAGAIGGLINQGTAQSLAQQSGIELDNSQYSRAYTDAQGALRFDPNNKQAVTVSHFAADRVDGVASGGLPGTELKGQSPGAAGGGAAGGSLGGFASLSAGGSSSDGAAGGAAGRLGAAGRAGSFGLSPSAPSAAALAGLSSGQAQKAAQNALNLKDYGSAMSYVNRALAQDPKNPELLNLRSQIYAHGKDYAAAEADARAGLAISPRDSALLRSLGFAQLREKDFKGALATANQMLELNPNDAYAYALRAHAYGSMGDRDAMIADITRAAELDPSFKDAMAQMSGRLQLPTDKDVLFLFPGEEDAAAPKPAAAPGSRNRSFGLLVGASALGGLLLALALLNTVLAPLKEQVTSAFTRITRTGPTVESDFDPETAQPASVNGYLPGLIRGQYEISRQIGQGGMGTVFEGTDRSLGRRVAIKKMREELRADPRERARFVAEAKTVAAMHHPNIVDIYAIADEGPDVYLVFEYVDGRTVHELVQTNGRLEPGLAARIVRGSAEALEYAHARGVIHRDMKPSNVMVDAQGRVKVMDFGIARAAKDAAHRFSMTNTVVGTPPYMAPEQEQGQVRRESDVYALAVCAYEMLTGNLPFAGTGGGMLLNKINMSYVPPSKETAGLPPALDPVFARAFQAFPEERYRTPREFSDALEAAFADPVRAV